MLTMRYLPARARDRCPRRWIEVLQPRQEAHQAGRLRRLLVGESFTAGIRVQYPEGDRGARARGWSPFLSVG